VISGICPLFSALYRIVLNSIQNMYRVSNEQSYDKQVESLTSNH